MFAKLKGLFNRKKEQQPKTAQQAPQMPHRPYAPQAVLHRTVSSAAMPEVRRDSDSVQPNPFGMTSPLSPIWHESSPTASDCGSNSYDSGASSCSCDSGSS